MYFNETTHIFSYCQLLRISHKSIKIPFLKKFSNIVNLNIIIERPLCPTHFLGAGDATMVSADHAVVSRRYFITKVMLLKPPKKLSKTKSS